MKEIRGGEILKREQFDSMLEQEHCLKGGLKEACIKASHFIRYAAPIGSDIIPTPECCVRNDEFLEAVRLILAVAGEHEDVVPELWDCDSDCIYSAKSACPGLFGCKYGSSKMCPHYVTEDK